MAIEGLINTSSDLVPEVVYKLGEIAIWLQALGVVIVLWLIFTIVSLIINLKRKKTLNSIKEDLERIEKKVDRISRRR